MLSTMETEPSSGFNFTYSKGLHQLVFMCLDIVHFMLSLLIMDPLWIYLYCFSCESWVNLLKTNKQMMRHHVNYLKLYP